MSTKDFMIEGRKDRKIMDFKTVRKKILAILAIMMLLMQYMVLPTYATEGEPSQESISGDKITTSYSRNSKTIYAKDIANATDKSKYYGAIVKGYTCANSEGVNNWKIFYADNNNIYLIADDYIKKDFAPKSATQEIHSYSSHWALNMKYVVLDYSGSSDITDEKIQALNSDYFNKGFTSTNGNMKAVAYMLDTNIWKGFAGDKAEYAVGGPTLEMLVKSYSQKYNVDYRAKADGSSGYKVSRDGGISWSTGYNHLINQTDSLYCAENEGLVETMWLATPSSYHPDYVMVQSHLVGYSQYFNYDRIGFRPLVCLQSNVRIRGR